MGRPIVFGDALCKTQCPSVTLDFINHLTEGKNLNPCRKVGVFLN